MSTLEEIKQFEKTFVRSGVQILKFFLHVSKKEQGKRLLERLEDPPSTGSSMKVICRTQFMERLSRCIRVIARTTSARKSHLGISFPLMTNGMRAVVADTIAQHVDELKLEYLYSHIRNQSCFITSCSN
ncbi:MAG: hypothetical protein U0905_17240 [Pirellulales bacterium]